MVTKAKPLFESGDTYTWDVNGLPLGSVPEYADSAMPYITLSTPDLLVTVPVAGGGSKEGEGEREREGDVTVPLCLDAGAGTLGSVLTVTPCLPNQDPAMNRARSQHFVLLPDATLRFYDPALAATGAAERFLCVTNHGPHESDPATLVNTLETCADSHNEEGGEKGDAVWQAWAFKGSAPGVLYKGQLLYGDGSNALGVTAEE